jgi:hypothetical protein
MRSAPSSGGSRAPTLVVLEAASRATIRLRAMRAAGSTGRHASARALAACVFLCTSAAGASVCAQDATTVDAGAEAEARALYAAGQAAFHDGRYEHALEYLQRSYELSHRPALLYNIGTTFDRLRARSGSARGLRAVPARGAERREHERGAGADRRPSRRARALAAGAGAGTRADTDTDADTRTDDDTAADALGDAGGHHRTALFGSRARAMDRRRAWAPRCSSPAPSSSVSRRPTSRASRGAQRGTAWTDVSGAYQRSEAESIAGGVLLGVGAAAAAAGIVWVATSGGSSEVEVAPTAGGLIVRGTF